MIIQTPGGPYVVGSAPAATLNDIRHYTASGFYNWEQDNIPIQDLEDRTDQLFEMMQGIASTAGLNVSSLGATLVLSSTADESNSVYSSMSTLINRIPRKLNYPVLVEICKYGDLGAFALEGFTFEGQGSLTFVNRNHGSTMHGSLSSNSVASGTASGTGYPWDISSVDTSIQSFKSEDLFSKISTVSSVHLSSNCYEASSWNSNVRTFGSQHLHTNDTFQEPFFFTSGSNAFISAGTSTSFVFSGNIYDTGVDATVAGDANPFEFSNSLEEPMRHANYITKPVEGDIVSPVYAYANYFTSVSVKDCRGSQIQLVGFCADGNVNTLLPIQSNSNNVGFDIQNSDVVLTSCASFRNKEAGFRIFDSNVSIEGGITGYRNYENNSGARVSNTYDLEDSWLLNTDGNGFEAFKSTIRFDEVSDTTNASGNNLGKHGFTMASNGRNGWVFENCKVLGGVGGHATSGQQGAGTTDYQTTQLISAFNKSNGFKIEDSKVGYKGILRAQGNNVNGIDISNSKVGVMGIISEINNNIGLKLNASEFVYNIGANKFFTGYDANTSAWESRAGHSANTPAVCTTWNSQQNIRVENNSVFSDSLLENSGSRAGLIGGREGSTTYRAMAAMNGNSAASAVGDYERGNSPLIAVTNNSYARLLGLSILGDTSDKTFSTSLKGPVKGRAVSVTKNSTVDLYGTSAFSTMISTYYAQDTSDYLRSSWMKSALYAGENSTIRISGPTKISNFGVAGLAEDSSKITIGPAMSKDGYFDESLNPLDMSGHSRVELQSTRACLVANNKSTLEMERCGAQPPSNSVNVYDLSSSSYDKHSGSFIQFYPHGFTEEILSVSGGKYDNTNFKEKLNASGTLLRTSEGIDTANNRANHNNVSTGGMCVRAVGGSNVLVDQVNFEVHMNASDLSGAYYNLDGSGREGVSVYSGSKTRVSEANSVGSSAHHYAGSQILMWNISDNSRILASNLNVNGLAASAAGFTGPAGRWGWTTNQSNPLGALDYYGQTGAFQQETGAAAGSYNYGPFRLLTGISSDLMSYGEALDEAYTASSLEYGQTLTLGGTAIHQLNAQGYAAPGLMASSISGSDFRKHSDIEQISGYGEVSYPAVVGQPIFGARATDASNITGKNGSEYRYLIANSMMEDYDASSGDSQLWPNLPIPPLHMEWQGYLRNFLDESAADTFANAKHGASKMIKLCSIFRSNTDWAAGGEGRDAYGNDSTYGLGVRSLNIFDLFKQL